MIVSLILLIITVIAIPIFAYKVYVDAMLPPPNLNHYKQFEIQIAADGLPIDAENLIACELDRPSYVGEGRLTKPWAELKSVADNQLGNESVLIIRTNQGDFAKVRLLEQHHVRVVTGAIRDAQVADELFDKEFETGKGNHPLFNKPE